MIGMGELAKRACNELSSITGLESSTVSMVAKDEKGWRLIVELIEKHSIPDGMDILGAYEALFDAEGNLLEFNRKGLRKRIDTEMM